MVPNLWKHRYLIRQLVVHEVGQRYRGSQLGLVWSFVTPLMMLAIYTFVFSVIFQARWSAAEGGTGALGEFALTLFAGLIPFNIFSEAVTAAPRLVAAVPNYVKKVVFPLEILPVVSLGSALVHSLLSVAVLVLAALLLQGRVSATVPLLPLAYIPLILFCLGLGWFLASLGVYVRDVGPTVLIVTQMLMFLSPVFYPLANVPEPMRGALHLNPLTAILDAFRRTLLWQEPIEWGAWLVWVVVGALVARAGYAWFMKTKHGFADVL